MRPTQGHHIVLSEIARVCVETVSESFADDLPLRATRCVKLLSEAKTGLIRRPIRLKLSIPVRARIDAHEIGLPMELFGCGVSMGDRKVPVD